MRVTWPFLAPVDGPLERLRGAPVARAPALAELGDHPSPSLGRAILPQLELRAPAPDLEPHGGQLSHRSAVERIGRVERPESPFGLVSREQPALLRRDGFRILGDPRLALEDDGPMIGGRRAPVLGMNPVGWDHREDLVDLEHAAGTDLQVLDLLIGSNKVQIQAFLVVEKRIETNVGNRIVAHCDEPRQLLGLHEAIDLGARNVRVVVVEDHAATLVRPTRSQK